MSRYEILAYCGLYCGGCSNYKENMNCQGCRYEQTLVSDCPTRACAAKRGLLHCGECNEFPCRRLEKFYNDGLRHHAMAFQNVRDIIEMGADEWLEEQAIKYKCTCGRRVFWFADRCAQCMKE